MRTKTMTLGSAIALAPLYDPLRFAEDSAVVDILSEGRLEMGLAIGYRRREYEAFGLDFGKRGAAISRSSCRLSARSGRAKPSPTKARISRSTMRAFHPLSPRGQLPLYIGGFVPKALERVARHGDGYFGNAEVWPMLAEKLAPNRERIRGTSVVMIPALYIAVARDPEAAMEELAPHYHFMHTSYGAWMNEDNAIGIDGAASDAMDLEAFKQSGLLQVITPDRGDCHDIGKIADRDAAQACRFYNAAGPAARTLPGLRGRFCQRRDPGVSLSLFNSR